MLSDFDINPLLSDPQTSTNPTSHGSGSNSKVQVSSRTDFGVDWLSCGYDVNPNYSRSLSPEWTVVGTGNPPEPDGDYEALTMQFPFMQTAVTVKYWPRLLKCYLSFNPSTALYGKSSRMAPPGACGALVGALIGELSQYVHPEFDLVDDKGIITRANLWDKSVTISRIDVSCNLYIDQPHQVKAALQAQNPKNMKQKITYQNGKKGWGLENKTKGEGKDIIYDKTEELKTHGVLGPLDPRGTMFRFESQLKRTRIKKFGLKALADISESRVWQALEARWGACRWGVSISEPGTIATAISGLTALQKESVLGYLQMHELGQQDDYTPSRHRHMALLLRSTGLSIGIPIAYQGEPICKLDIGYGGLRRL